MKTICLLICFTSPSSFLAAINPGVWAVKKRRDWLIKTNGKEKRRLKTFSMCFFSKQVYMFQLLLYWQHGDFSPQSVNFSCVTDITIYHNFLVCHSKKKNSKSKDLFEPTFQTEFLICWPQTELKTKSSTWAFPGAITSLLRLCLKQRKSRFLHPSKALHGSMYGGECLGSVINIFSTILSGAVAAVSPLYVILHIHGHDRHSISVKTSGSHLFCWRRPPMNRCASASMTLWHFSWPLTSTYGWGTLWTQWHHWTQIGLSGQPRSRYLRLSQRSGRICCRNWRSELPTSWKHAPQILIRECRAVLKELWELVQESLQQNTRL